MAERLTRQISQKAQEQIKQLNYLKAGLDAVMERLGLEQQRAKDSMLTFESQIKAANLAA